jgi:HD-like signal output (HDOD) protein
MPDRLATLAKMQERLRENAEALASQVDENPDGPQALQYLRLAADCANLECDIDLLSKLLLAGEEPDGTC